MFVRGCTETNLMFQKEREFLSHEAGQLFLFFESSCNLLVAKWWSAKRLGIIFSRTCSLNRSFAVQNKSTCTHNLHVHIPVQSIKTALLKPTEFTPEFKEGQMFICSVVTSREVQTRQNSANCLRWWLPDNLITPKYTVLREMLMS